MYLMLRLNYVPGGHGSSVCPKCIAPWDLVPPPPPHLYPLHIHGFFLRVLTDRTNSRIYHGSLRFGHFYDRFKSCYELSRAIYGLLRIITSYYDILTAEFHDLLRVVMDNYGQLTC